MPSFHHASQLRSGKRTPTSTIIDITTERGWPRNQVSLRSLLDIMPLNALVARLAIQVAERRGKSLDHLERTLFWKLFDLASEGDPAARLLYTWLGAADGLAAPPIKKPQAPPMPCFRHGRLWISASALKQADIICERQLREIARLMEGI